MPNNMTFLKIGSTDVSGWIDKQSYQVNSEDVYENWTDGNWITHRVIARQRISGSCKAGFSKAADFAAFRQLLTTERQPDGWYTVTVYVNSTGATETIQAYLDVEGDDRWDLLNSRQWQVQEIRITGR